MGEGLSLILFFLVLFVFCYTGYVNVNDLLKPARLVIGVLASDGLEMRDVKLFPG